MSKNENTLRLFTKNDIINETLNELLISINIINDIIIDIKVFFSFVSQ
jgi:hypothetical protein